MYEQDVITAVGRVLILMVDRPNARRVPTERDLPGKFDVWFDGGAVKHDTGISVFRFIDGTTATTDSCCAMLAIHIRLADGRFLQILEKQRDALHPLALHGLE